MTHSGYDSLIRKLDEFIRKYYKNQMLRGLIYCVGIIVGAFLLMALLEYFGRFNSGVRTFMFWSFIGLTGYVLVRFFAIPLGHMLRFGKIISHEQAAQIVGQHFPDVQDKLLNTLQLKHMADGAANNVLLEASIKQKTEALRPVSFTSAIDLRENRKYLPYALPPVAVVLILLFAAPSVITKSTDRLLRHGEEIAEDAPFQFSIANDLAVAENADFTANIKINGKELPAQAYVVFNGQQFLLNKTSATEFTYTFHNVKQNVPFRLYASGFYSDGYELNVLPTPKLVDFEVAISYPAYLKRPDEKLKNSGDLLVPEGAKLEWIFSAANTDELNLRIGDKWDKAQGGGENYRYQTQAKQSCSYAILTSNAYFKNRDSIVYQLQVVPDIYPTIAVEEARDSNSFRQLYFTGEVNDDYGFKRLTFNYRFIASAEGRPSDQLETVELPVSRDFNTDEFFHHWDLSQIDLQPGEKIEYYFEVWDNDGVNGSKSARTSSMQYAAPTVEELQEQIDNQNEDIKDKLEESIKDAQKIQKELEELQRQLKEKKELSWQDQKKLDELLKKQQELQKQIEEIQKQNQQKNEKQNEFQQQNESILEKQEQLEKLMEEVLTPEMQKMMEELQKLMEELNKEEIQEQLDQMDMTNEDLEKELERALEEFKQLQWEQKMEEAIEELKQLGEEQEKLGEESEKKESDPQDLKEKQDSLSKSFDEIQKKLEEAEKLNEELQNPNNTPETEQQEQEIDQEQQKSSEELQKNKKSSASKSQKSAGEKMKQMAQQMEMSMAGSEQQQQQEDMEALRALLENIITLSFDQEDLMASFKSIDQKDPNYNKLGQTQRKLKDDAKMVEDSLFALSLRVPQLSSIVNHEINLVNENMELALENIPDRKTPEVTTAQQYVMTSFNNLALLLDEALQQMQQQSSCKKPGTGNCEKPGGMGQKPSPSTGQMKKMQEQLSKQLEEMKAKGQNKGQNNSGKEGMSKELSEMAAKQAAIRKAMEEKARELNEDGSGNGNELKEIAKEMEELQRDIVNNKVSEETLRRQQDILTRLLKAENAERVREQDNQRKSNEADDYPTSNPEKYEQYLRRKEQETELLKTVPPNLKPYYREKVNEYFNKLAPEE
ncbi:MAG: hypothetical protein JNM00_01390 [Flavobacteriales bacterium]|nr:hypothetical protein [Flavobacteriales bacterium]